MSRKKIAVTLALFLAVASAKAEPAMWVIKDADSTIYLIGTMHLLKHDTEWNADKVKKTVHESTELWLEVADLDNDAALAPLMMKFGVDPAHPLSSKLNEEQHKKLERIAGAYGFPVASLEPMQPWLAAVVLSVGPIIKAGYDPKAGVERLLSAQAKAEGDKIRGFETAEEQFQILAGLSEAEQIAFLISVFDDLEKGVDLVDRLAKAWIDGDIDTITRLSVDDIKKEAPTIYQKFIVRRNIAWSEKIAGMLKGSGVQLIAVGAAHLVGPDSVQAQLAKRGIKAERY
ncbi:MAG: TraB/GumN family protein [Verrucomicrobiota bacterium]|nr:TraB/GumN family protein [Verrucomicrobiota bacterium]